MTETQRAAMRLALEALEFFRGTAICDADTKVADESITALCVALAEPEPATEVLRISASGIHANPDIPADEAAKAVLAALDAHLVRMADVEIAALKAERDALLKALVDLMPLAEFGAAEQSPPYADEYLLNAAQAAIDAAREGDRDE